MADKKNRLGEFRRYLAQARMLSAATVRRYVATVEAYAAERGSLRSVNAIAAATRADALRFLWEKQSHRSAPSRANWNGQLSALRALYRWLIEEEVITVDPTQSIEWMKPDDPDRVPLSLDEAIALVGVARECSPEPHQSRNVALLQVFIHCGLRVSEVASLTVDQVDFENRLFLGVRSKGDRRLAVRFNDVVAEALEAYLADRRGLDVPEEERTLFVSTQRRRMSVRSIEYLVKGLAARAGISRVITPHYLRHTSATLLVDEGGADISVAQKHLGHALGTTTQKYVHPHRRELAGAVDRLGTAWRRRANRPQRQKPASDAESRMVDGNA